MAIISQRLHAHDKRQASLTFCRENKEYICFLSVSLCLSLPLSVSLSRPLGHAALMPSLAAADLPHSTESSSFLTSSILSLFFVRKKSFFLFLSGVRKATEDADREG